MLGDQMRPDKEGRYGKFGGKYVPETLIPALEDLTREYELAMKDESFKVCLPGAQSMGFVEGNHMSTPARHGEHVYVYTSGSRCFHDLFALKKPSYLICEAHTPPVQYSLQLSYLFASVTSL